MTLFMAVRNSICIGIGLAPLLKSKGYFFPPEISLFVMNQLGKFQV